MAKTAAQYTTLEALPDPLPDGTELVRVEATVNTPDGKDTEKTLVSLFVPAYGNGAGAVNYGKHYSEHNAAKGKGEKAAPNGNDFITGAMRGAIRSTVTRLVTTETASQGHLILPPPSDIRVVDPSEVVAMRVQAAIVAGDMPDQKTLNLWYKEAGLL